MELRRIFAVFLPCVVCLGGRSQVEEEVQLRLTCVQHERCGPCLAAPAHARCRWCADPYFHNDGEVPRCNHEDSLVAAGCAQFFIKFPERSEMQVIQDAALQDRLPHNSSVAVQIRPQRVRIRLRPHESRTVNVTYRPARNYPLDLYYLMDLTYSMKDDKETLVRLRDDLPVMINNLTNNFRLGFGSFADKPLMPYSIGQGVRLQNPCASEGYVCEPTYSFRHRLPLTNDVAAFVQRVNGTSVTANLDNAEAGLDALLQALVCTEELGWSDASRKIIIVLTDGLLHFAGDGLLGGVIARNDEKCHLDANGFYSSATEFDYPSLEQIYRLIRDKRVNIIFAVTEPVEGQYRSLQELFRDFIHVGKLEEDSSNILKLVRKGYEDIVSTVNLVDDSTSGLKLTYYSDCGKNGTMVKTQKCSGVEFGKSYNFEVKVSMDACPTYTKGQKQTITIKDTQLGQDSLTLDVELLCGCDCEGDETGVESLCQGHSSMNCGVCECTGDWSGPNCDCEVTDHAASVSLNAKCRDPNATRAMLCSGVGDCLCGSCYCDRGWTGKYCQCKSCPINPDNGLECGGPERGACGCGACACAPGAWSGDACACSVRRDTCVAPGDTQPCSARGDCVCGRCQCSISDGARYAGQFCESCATCINTMCAACERCVECTLFDKCTAECTGDVACNVTKDITDGTLESEAGQAWCVLRVLEAGMECEYAYTYRALGARAVGATVRTRRCAQTREAMAMTSGLIIMAFTIAAGLLAIAAVKSFQVVSDRRAYAQFRREAEKSVAEMSNQNPLYKSPISEFTLPESYPRETPLY